MHHGAAKGSARPHSLVSDTLIPLGQVVNVHATHGELRLRPFNPASTVLNSGAEVVLRRGTESQQRRIRAVRPHKHFLLLTLEGCDSMTAAEALIGYEVCVHEAELPPTAAHEIYHYQLLGMTVVTAAGVSLGTVAEVLTTGSSDVCIVRGAGREYLIPLIADIVKQIDRQQSRLVIEPLPGLLDE